MPYVLNPTPEDLTSRGVSPDLVPHVLGYVREVQHLTEPEDYGCSTWEGWWDSLRRHLLGEVEGVPEEVSSDWTLYLDGVLHPPG